MGAGEHVLLDALYLRSSSCCCCFVVVLIVVDFVCCSHSCVLCSTVTIISSSHTQLMDKQAHHCQGLWQRADQHWPLG